MLAVSIWLAGDVTAQEGATRTLTILAARCPAGYAGDASADECDDTPMPAVTFRVGRPYTDFVITARTDDDGIVVVFDITDLPYRGTIRVIEDLPPGTARVVAFCVDDAGTPLAITDEPFPDNDPPIAAALVTVGETGMSAAIGTTFRFQSRRVETPSAAKTRRRTRRRKRVRCVRSDRRVN